MAKLKLQSKRRSIEGVLTTSANASGNASKYTGFAITLCSENENQNSERERDYHRLEFDAVECEYLVKALSRYLATRLGDNGEVLRDG